MLAKKIVGFSRGPGADATIPGDPGATSGDPGAFQVRCKHAKQTLTIDGYNNNNFLYSAKCTPGAGLEINFVFYF